MASQEEPPVVSWSTRAGLRSTSGNDFVQSPSLFNGCLLARKIWGGDVSRVFPPCDTSQLAATVGDRNGEEVTFLLLALVGQLLCSQVRVLSIGQFRPEKDHPLQIKAMFELRQIITEEEWAKVKLVIVGGCRNQEDWKLVQDLKDLTKYLSVEENVEFKVNLPFPDLLNEFSKALIGIHTMHQEHFGIGIVEMMSAGLLTVANRSGGPLMDIVVEEQVKILAGASF